MFRPTTSTHSPCLRSLSLAYFHASPGEMYPLLAVLSALSFLPFTLAACCPSSSARPSLALRPSRVR